MGEELKNNFSHAEIDLIAGDGGIFEIAINGRELFSKKKAGRFPEAAEIIAVLKKATA